MRRRGSHTHTHTQARVETALKPLQISVPDGTHSSAECGPGTTQSTSRSKMPVLQQGRCRVRTSQKYMITIHSTTGYAPHVAGDETHRNLAAPDEQGRVDLILSLSLSLSVFLALSLFISVCLSVCLPTRAVPAERRRTRPG